MPPDQQALMDLTREYLGSGQVRTLCARRASCSPCRPATARWSRTPTTSGPRTCHKARELLNDREPVSHRRGAGRVGLSGGRRPDPWTKTGSRSGGIAGSLADIDLHPRQAPAAARRRWVDRLRGRRTGFVVPRSAARSSRSNGSPGRREPSRATTCPSGSTTAAPRTRSGNWRRPWMGCSTASRRAFRHRSSSSRTSPTNSGHRSPSSRGICRSWTERQRPTRIW